MPVQGEAYMEGYCYKSLLKVDRLIGGGAKGLLLDPTTNKQTSLISLLRFKRKIDYLRLSKSSRNSDPGSIPDTQSASRARVQAT